MQMRVATCNIAEFISILPALPLCPWGDAIACVCVSVCLRGWSGVGICIKSQEEEVGKSDWGKKLMLRFTVIVVPASQPNLELASALFIYLFCFVYLFPYL